MCKMATLMYSSKTLPPYIIPCPEAGVFSSFPASLDTQVAKHEEAHRPVCGGSASGQCGDREGCVGYLLDIWAFSCFDMLWCWGLHEASKEAPLCPFGQTHRPKRQREQRFQLPTELAAELQPRSKETMGWWTQRILCGSTGLVSFLGYLGTTCTMCLLTKDARWGKW